MKNKQKYMIPNYELTENDHFSLLNYKWLVDKLKHKTDDELLYDYDAMKILKKEMKKWRVPPPNFIRNNKNFHNYPPQFSPKSLVNSDLHYYYLKYK